MALGVASLVWTSNVAAPQVVITEVHYHPPSGLGDGLEFVELHNTSSKTVSIAGWHFREGIDFTFPDEATLAPAAHVLVSKNLALFEELYGAADHAAAFGDFGGSLSDAGEELVLVDRFNAFVDAVRYEDDSPWPEDADGEGASLQRLCATAPGWDHRNWTSDAPTPLEAIRAARCPPPPYLAPRVVINEIHYHPTRRGAGSGDLLPVGDDGEKLEYVELHNLLDEAVDLGNFRFSDGVEYEFPPGTVVPARGYLVVCRDADAVRKAYGITNATGDFRGRLSNSGERLTLATGTGQIVDSVRYEDSGDWPYGADGEGRSLEKVVSELSGDDPANWAPSAVPRSRFLRLEAQGPRGQGFTQRIALTLDGEGEVLVDNIALVDLSRPGENLLANGSFDGGLDGWSLSGNVSGSRWEASAGVGSSGALRLVSSGRCPPGGCGLGDGAFAEVTVPADLDRTYLLSLELAILRGPLAFRAGLARGVMVDANEIVTETPGRRNSVASSTARPFVSQVGRFPTEPTPSDPIWITALVRAPAPVEVAMVYDSGGGEVELPLSDDGAHRDGRRGDGVFGAHLPSFPHDTRVRYRIVATADRQVAESPRPVDREEPQAHEWWGTYVNGLQATSPLPIYHILLDGVDGNDWESVNRQLDCGVLRTGDFSFQGELYPRVGLRFRGNTACSYPKRSFKVVFNRGRLFRGLRKINLNGLWTDKSMVRECLAWDFVRQLGAPYARTEFVRLHVSGSYYGLYLYVEHPDQRFLERNSLDPDGNLYKSTAQDGVGRQPSGQYDLAWEKETNEGTSFADLEEFVDSMHDDGTSASGPSAAFWQDRSLPEMVLAFQVSQVVLNNSDSQELNHFLYHDLGADRWGILAWDLDLTFGKYAGGGAANLNDRMVSAEGFNLDPWHMTVMSGGFARNYFQDYFLRAGRDHFQRAYLIRLWDVLEEKFRVDVYESLLREVTARLEADEAEDRARWGRYPSNVPGFPEAMLPNVEILKREIFLHRRFLRQYIETFHPRIPEHTAVKLTELMVLPEGDRDDLEFLEFLNTSAREVDLSGWTIEGIGYTFPPGSVVAANATIVVARSPRDFRRRYPEVDTAQLLGPYTGRLANDGEVLRVRDAGPGYPATVDYLCYANGGSWPSLRPGHSIELTRVAADRDNDGGEAWRLSTFAGGTPGVALPDFVRGDANSDATVAMEDVLYTLDYLFRSGSPPPCLDAADSDDNGRVELTDAVLLLNHLVLGGPPLPAPYPERGLDLTLDPLNCSG